MNPPLLGRVIGVGSPHGDDAVGWHIVRGLPPRPGVEVHALLGWHDLPSVLDGRGWLIIVDACVTGAAPGTISRFGWPDTRLPALRPGSTHGIGPGEALGLAQSLGLLPHRVDLFGVEATLATGDRLSAAVAAVVPEAVRLVNEEIAGKVASGGIQARERRHA